MKYTLSKAVIKIEIQFKFGLKNGQSWCLLRETELSELNTTPHSAASPLPVSAVGEMRSLSSLSPLLNTERGPGAPLEPTASSSPHCWEGGSRGHSCCLSSRKGQCQGPGNVMACQRPWECQTEMPWPLRLFQLQNSKISCLGCNQLLSYCFQKKQIIRTTSFSFYETGNSCSPKCS